LKKKRKYKFEVKENVFSLKENVFNCFQTHLLRKAAINQKNNKKIKTNSKKIKISKKFNSV